MKLVKALLGTATLVAASWGPVYAGTNDKVEIMNAGYGGNGCPANSASVTVSPDGQQL
jgi:hypothetical protein